jgi:hypothetical protein
MSYWFSSTSSINASLDTDMHSLNRV